MSLQGLLISVQNRILNKVLILVNLNSSSVTKEDKEMFRFICRDSLLLFEKGTRHQVKNGENIVYVLVSEKY